MILFKISLVELAGTIQQKMCCNITREEENPLKSHYGYRSIIKQSFLICSDLNSTHLLVAERFLWLFVVPLDCQNAFQSTRSHRPACSSPLTLREKHQSTQGSGSSKKKRKVKCTSIDFSNIQPRLDVLSTKHKSFNILSAVSTGTGISFDYSLRDTVKKKRLPLPTIDQHKGNAQGKVGGQKRRGTTARRDWGGWVRGVGFVGLQAGDEVRGLLGGLFRGQILLIGGHDEPITAAPPQLVVGVQLVT